MIKQSSLPLVSAIIPTRNRPDMLIRAINSITRQTYQNIEIIVVDDGSECDVGYQLQKEIYFEKCRIIKNKRKPGAAGARNTGFYESKGVFLGFLDDDDEWLPEKIGKQIEAFQKKGEDVGIVCTYDIVIHDGKSQLRYRRLEGNMYDVLCREHIAGNTSNPLIKRSVLEDIGLFDEDMPAAQDTDLWLRIARRYLFTTVNEPLVLIHQDSSDRITIDNQKRIQGMYMLLCKYWYEFPIQRKYKLIKHIAKRLLS